MSLSHSKSENLLTDLDYLQFWPFLQVIMEYSLYEVNKLDKNDILLVLDGFDFLDCYASVGHEIVGFQGN